MICGSVLYFVGGALFNRFWRGHTGYELIPNKDFWVMLPGLVKDGNVFAFKKCIDLVNKMRGRYETV